MVDPALATQATVLTFCPKPGLPQRHTACRFWWSQREGFQSQVHVYLLKLLTNDSNNQPFFAPRDIVNLFPHQALNFIPCKNSGSQVLQAMLRGSPFLTMQTKDTTVLGMLPLVKGLFSKLPQQP